MVTHEILNSYTAAALRKEISKTNIRGYSKMNKKELIDVMMKNKERFTHMKQKEFVAPKKTKRGTGTVGQAKKFMAGIQDKLKEVKKTADVKPVKKPQNVPQYDELTATEVATELVKDLVKQGEDEYLTRTARADNIKRYLRNNVPKIKRFQSDVSGRGLAGMMKSKPLKGKGRISTIDLINSRDFIADLLNKNQTVDNKSGQAKF